MAFYGCEFSFNGIPSSQYGLMLYDIGGIVEDGTFSSGLEIVEDRTARRYKPLFYGVKQNTPLTFTMTFGVHPKDIDQGRSLDRYDMAVVAVWLTGQDGYRYLEIAQPDMEAMRYRCIITELSYVTWGQIPWAFRCTVTCDSPFAYLRPEVYTCAAGSSVTVRNRAASKYYYPLVSISVPSGMTNVSITNTSDGNRVCGFTNIPGGQQTITIDNENEVITTTADLNLYDTFNNKFLRLVRGDNVLNVAGGAVTITCEYPINIGG